MGVGRDSNLRQKNNPRTLTVVVAEYVARVITGKLRQLDLLLGAGGQRWPLMPPPPITYTLVRLNFRERLVLLSHRVRQKADLHPRRL